jgi:DNA-binding NarL/FixJ family response regulator
MASRNMRRSETRAQDLVTVLIAGPHGWPGVVPLGTDIDLVGGLDAGLPGVNVVGRVHTGTEAAERVLELQPEVLVLDTGIENVSPRTTCRQIQQWAPATKVLAIAAADDERLYTTIASGASSALTFDQADDTLIDAINRLARGESLLPPRAAQRLLNDIDAWSSRSSDPLYPPPTLTSTEREVLRRLGEGDGPDTIASDFNVTSHLVNLHTGFAVSKLHRFLTGTDHQATTGG